MVGSILQKYFCSVAQRLIYRLQHRWSVRAIKSARLADSSKLPRLHRTVEPSDQPTGRMRRPFSFSLVLDADAVFLVAGAARTQ